MKEITFEMMENGDNPFCYPTGNSGQKRFNYFLERISSFEDNEDLRYDLAMRLKNISSDLFWWIDYRDSRSDCFITILDELFNSDSYVELNNKLDAIESASYFSKVSKYKFDIYYKLLDSLKSGKYKDKSQGNFVICDKSSRLIDRTSSIYDESLIDVHSSAKSIEEMVLALGRYDYDYGLFCHNYVEKIDRDLEDSLSSFTTFPKGYEDSKWEEECDIPFGTRLFDTCDWKKRKEYIISKFKELGLNKEFRDKFISCYEKNDYGFLNLYMIAIAYEFQKDNFNNFSAVLDDMKVIPDYCTEFTALDFFKYFVGFFVACSDYKDIKDVRESFKFFLNNFDGRCYSDIVNIVVNRCKYIIDCKDDFCRNEVYGLTMRKVLEDRDFYFSSLFIWGKRRLSYINDKLHEIESNPSIRNEIFMNLNELVVSPFKVLNEGNCEDSFFECMDIVFDSDTYHELYSKLKLLRKAVFTFGIGNKKGALKILKEIDSDKNKEMFNGEIVSYDDKMNLCINMIEKPKRIIDRMKKLYLGIENSFDVEYLDSIHKNASSLKDLCNKINYYKLGKNVKRKVKSLFVK